MRERKAAFAGQIEECFLRELARLDSCRGAPLAIPSCVGEPALMLARRSNCRVRVRAIYQGTTGRPGPGQFANDPSKRSAPGQGWEHCQANPSAKLSAP